MTRNAFQKYIRAALVFAGLGMLLALPSPEARAQNQPPATGAKFGSVDVPRIMNESKARQRDGAELQQLIGTLREVVQKLQDSSARFLTEPEIKELAALFEKKMPTEAEKKRLSQLTDAAAIKSSAMRRLENTANATPEESKQLSELTAAAQKGQESLKNLGTEFQRRLEKREVELNDKTITEIRGVIAKIAQEKGLTVVFDSAVAIYTANDITDDVIKQINK